MDATKDFLGNGWKFPPRLNARGQVELISHEQDIEEAVRIILGTMKGERPMRPEFGSELHLLTFAPNDASTAGAACRYVEEALLRWEPRIEDLEVHAAPDAAHPERLMIDIRYTVRTTNDMRNLVYPFYIIPGE
jgi:hypothetical protein